MTHDELLAKIDAEIVYCGCDGYVNCGDDNEPWVALRAVVERHHPFEFHLGDVISEIQCAECEKKYPCKTIVDIKKELQ